ncbi:MAG: nucleotidyltransferase family protein [Clostridia bacterium]|nr:nucleotidyltransferase family protein [Clostridia bacterium]
MKELKLVLSAVRRAVFGVEFLAEDPPSCWEKACSLAKAHDLSSVVLEGFAEQIVPPSVTEQLLRRSAASLASYYAQNEAMERLTKTLAQNGIDYLPLKGAVLRYLYPNPEWRVGRDVDVLVRPSDFDRARQIATAVLSPVKIGEGRHDVGFTCSDGVRIELHFSLFNGDEGFGDLLSDPFAHAILKAEHRYELPDAELYAYHLAHMAKHFRHGGCGLRAFLDLYLLRQSLSSEALADAEALLVTAGLDQFAAVAWRQSRVFFAGELGDADTERLGRFVARNQAFGSFRSVAAAQAHKKEKKHGFCAVWARAFPSYRNMCYLYPVLRCWPVLLPFCWIARGFRLFSKKDRDRFVAATRAASRVGDTQVEEMAEIYQYLKLEG